MIRYGLHALAAKNDFCLEEGILSVLRQSDPSREMIDVLISCPTHKRDGSPNPWENAEDLKKMAERNGWEFRLLDTSDLYPASNRPSAHAEERNRAAEEIRKKCDYLIVLDADELWLPGLLERCSMLAERAQIQSASAQFVPVIGIPGFPVEGAMDEFPVLYRSDLRFVYSRSWRTPDSYPKIRWARLGRGVLHFTMTRRSFSEIERKIKSSSHYGEEGYNYDDWLNKTFQHIEPGMTDVSFYTDKRLPNFWPLVREFSPEEWQYIPDSLKPFLKEPPHNAS